MGTSNRWSEGSVICSRTSRKRISTTAAVTARPAPESRVLAHLDAEPRVRLMTYVHLQSEDVPGVVGPHLLHQRALLVKGGLVDGHQRVGREICRVEAPREAVSPRGLGGGGGKAGGCGDEAAVPGLAQLPGHDHSSFWVTVEPPALWDETAAVAEGRSGGVVQSRCGRRLWSCSSGRRWRSAQMLAGRPVKPEDGAEQPDATQEQQQAADQQEGFVEGPRWPTQQQVGFVLPLQVLKTQGKVINIQRAID